MKFLLLFIEKVPENHANILFCHFGIPSIEFQMVGTQLKLQFKRWVIFQEDPTHLMILKDT